MNVTSMYSIYIYDSCNDYFEKTISIKILNQEYAAVRKLYFFLSAKIINFDSFTPTITSYLIGYVYY